MWGTLRRWFADKTEGQPPLRVVLYTRQGCHLCEDALRMLQEYGADYRLALEAVDIDLDSELAARYGDKVPVIEVGGRPRLWGRIKKVLLRRLLLAEAENR